MKEPRLLQVGMLYLLWALPLLIGLLLYAAHRRRLALAAFADHHLLPRINTNTSSSRRRLKAGLVLAAFALTVIGLARPAWNPVVRQVHRRGRDVVFLLDVSKSMLADDLRPNRLERAKLDISDAVDQLRGDRVALVVFAGNAVVKCPLTFDYGFFRMVLHDVSTDSVSRGGTMIGDAIRTTIKQVLGNAPGSHRDLILITDGEDHGSYPVQAAQELGRLGVRLIAIGLGDEKQGHRIPVRDASGHRIFLRYHGREVWSKLDAVTLRRMVEVTPGGRYLNVATGSIDFGSVYVKLVDSAAKTRLGATTFKKYEEKFQIFLTLAFLLLCIELAIGERKPGT